MSHLEANSAVFPEKNRPKMQEITVPLGLGKRCKQARDAPT